MSKITYEEVKGFLESNDWELLSASYTNLNTDLEVKCKNGHILSIPYKTLRKGCICPICQKEQAQSYQVKTTDKTDSFRILAIDQATILSGWSLWDDKKIIAYGTFFADEKLSTIERLIQVRQWLIEMVKGNKPDLVLLEDIQLQDFHNNQKNKTEKYDNVGIVTFKILAKLQGVLEATLTELKVDYKIVHSASWRAELNIKGRSRVDKKRSAQFLIKDWYGINATEDEADAICIGKYGTEKYSAPIKMINWG